MTGLLLSIIVASTAGGTSPADHGQQKLEPMAKDPGWSPLAIVFGRILNGHRAPISPPSSATCYTPLSW